MRVDEYARDTQSRKTEDNLQNATGKDNTGRWSLVQLFEGETLGIVGESGCGKTITAFSIIKLLPKNAILGDETKISFRGRDIATLEKSDLHKIRGKSISMVFQEPMTSLNPLYTIGWQISEVYKLHEGLNDEEAMERSVEMLRLVGIPEPQSGLKSFRISYPWNETES